MAKWPRPLTLVAVIFAAAGLIDTAPAGASSFSAHGGRAGHDGGGAQRGPGPRARGQGARPDHRRPHAGESRGGGYLYYRPSPRPGARHGFGQHPYPPSRRGFGQHRFQPPRHGFGQHRFPPPRHRFYTYPRQRLHSPRSPGHSCHRIITDGRDRFGYRAKFASTVCYNYYGHRYVVPGSRRLIRRY